MQCTAWSATLFSNDAIGMDPDIFSSYSCQVHPARLISILIVAVVCCDVQDVDAATRRALLEFNLHLAVGRLEDAFRAVASVRSPAVWQSMAHMAIKSKRLDVAGEDTVQQQQCMQQYTVASAI